MTTVVQLTLNFDSLIDDQLVTYTGTSIGKMLFVAFVLVMVTILHWWRK